MSVCLTLSVLMELSDQHTILESRIAPSPVWKPNHDPLHPLRAYSYLPHQSFPMPLITPASFLNPTYETL